MASLDRGRKEKKTTQTTIHEIHVWHGERVLCSSGKLVLPHGCHFRACGDIIMNTVCVHTVDSFSLFI